MKKQNTAHRSELIECEYDGIFLHIQLLIANGYWEEANKEIIRLENIYPGMPFADYFRALMYKKRKLFDLAAKAIIKTLEIAGDKVWPEANILYSEICRSIGLYKEGLATLLLAADLVNSVNYFIELAKTYYCLGKKKKSLRILKRALISEDRINPKVAHVLGEYYQLENKLSKSDYWFRIAVENGYFELENLTSGNIIEQSQDSVMYQPYTQTKPTLN